MPCTTETAFAERVRVLAVEPGRLPGNYAVEAHDLNDGFQFRVRVAEGEREFFSSSCEDGVETAANLVAVASASASTQSVQDPDLSPQPHPATTPAAHNEVPSSVSQRVARWRVGVQGFAQLAHINILPEPAPGFGVDLHVALAAITVGLRAAVLLPIQSAALGPRVGIQAYTLEPYVGYNIEIASWAHSGLTVQPELALGWLYTMAKGVDVPTPATGGADLWNLQAGVSTALNFSGWTFGLRASLVGLLARHDYVLQDGTLLYRTGQVGVTAAVSGGYCWNY